MESNKYFDELKRTFGFECRAGDTWRFKCDADFVCYESESAEGNVLYVFKEAGSDINIMRDVFTDKSRFVECIMESLLDGASLLVEHNLHMWLDMDITGPHVGFWERFYEYAVKEKLIEPVLV